MHIKLKLKISAYPARKKKKPNTKIIYLKCIIHRRNPSNEISQLPDERGKIINNEEIHIQKHASPRFRKTRMTAVSYWAAKAFFSPLVTK